MQGFGCRNHDCTATRTASLPPVNARTIVAIPAKNEAERIEACMLAVTQQSTIKPDAVVLVVNNTSDQTAVIVRGLGQSVEIPIDAIEHDFPPEQACAGSARRMAMERAVALAGPDGLVLTTDADGRVPVD